MKTFVLALCALVVMAAGAAPLVLAQDSSSSSSPSATAPSANPPAAAPSVNAPKPSDTASPPSGKVEVDVKSRSDKSDDAGAASPRTGDAQRTGFFGLSPTAAIIVSVAVLLVVILAIVAMTHSSGSTYIDTDRRV
jgi:hypothetical protein